MNRRIFLLAAGASAALACAGPAFAAAPAFLSKRISVITYGQGPDVILIPGLTASRDVWNGTVAAVPGYRYHLVQVAGFAGVPAGGNAKGAVVAPVAAEIARYISATKLASPAIVGHSMGGTIAMLLAAHNPKLVGRVMVVDIMPQPAGLLGASASGIRPLADGLRDIFTGSQGGRRLLENLMGRFGGESDAARQSDPDVVARASHELALLDLTPDLPRITAPMTVVYATPPAGGTADPARIVANYKAAYAGARTAKLVRVADSGHMIMDDQPARFRAALKAFLA